MAELEDKPRDFWQSLAWAAETLSTTGYGADARWSHPAMVVLVAAVQFAGVFFVFLIFPIYLIPFLEERFQTPASPGGGKRPRRARGDLPVSTGGSRPCSKSSPGRACPPWCWRRMRTWPAASSKGAKVLHGIPTDGTLEAARIATARAVIANGTDDENAAFILSARQLGYGGPSWRWSRSPTIAGP